jgi:hypothetical protein
MSSIKALDIAVRRLSKSRMPSIRAAVFTLAELQQELAKRQESERAARIAAFESNLPRAA